MAGRTLFEKIWDEHVVTSPAGEPTILYIDLHLIHEVTSPQAFQMLRDRGLKVMYPERTLATVDHIIPTLSQARPFADSLAEEMMSAIEKNCRDFGITLLNLSDKRQGIVHVVGPELGLTQPGITLACGSGACAAVVAGIRLGWLDSTVHVDTRGGRLTISWAGPGQAVMMTGPAVKVFDGEIDVPEL